MSKGRAKRKKKSKDGSEQVAKRPKSRRGRYLWALGVVILAAGATVYAVPVLDRLEEQRTEIAESTTELDLLLAENADLQERLDHLNTPLEIERLARERLGFVRAGETAIVVVPVPVEVPEPEVVEEPVEPPMPGPDPWYKEWWNYISGSDLAEAS